MSEAQPWETKAVHSRLPVGASLVSACWQPLPGRAMRMSPDDVEALTTDKVRQRLPPGHQLVLSIRDEDLDPATESNVARLLKATDGGLLIVGVTYELSTARRSRDIACPECASGQIDALGPADQHVRLEQRGQTSLFQCQECGSAWDQ